MRQNYLVIIIAIIAVAAGAAGFFYGDKIMPSLASGKPAILPSEVKGYHLAYSLDKTIYDGFYQSAEVATPVSDKVFSGVIPHHLIAGKYLASYFEKLANQSPPVVVLIGPNHPNVGPNAVVSGILDWRTPYGDLSVEKNIIADLERKQAIVVDDKIIGSENSIATLVPFIKKTWPKAEIVPLIVKYKTKNEIMENLAKELASVLPANSLVLASVDFSHYQPLPVANFHDELSLNILETDDLSRVVKMEIDSQPSIYFLLKYNQLKQAQKFNLVFHTNSAGIMNQPDLAETTSHVLGYFTSGAATATPLVSLQFFGDMMLERNVAKAMGSKGLDYLFDKIKGRENRFFYGMDELVVNLEGPFALRRIVTSKEIAFRFDPKYALELKKYGFTAFNLANNHSYDMGVSNVVFTRTLLTQNGLNYFGDQLNENAKYTWYQEVAGQKIAFIGFNLIGDELDKNKALGVLTVARAKSDYVIVSMHWGEEYKQKSNQSQRDFGHWLIDNGADAVIGQHPHVVQEMEIYKDKPIFYSLGNFVFDQYFSKATQEGLSVGLTLQDGKVKSVYLFPFFGVKSQLQLTSKGKQEQLIK